MSKVQIRGTCQVCGNRQAVRNGVISHHGYTVQRGWFEGACPGSRQKPLENSREFTDLIIQRIKEEVVALEEKLASCRRGEFPAEVSVRKREGFRTWTEMVPLDSLSDREQNRHKQNFINRTESRIFTAPYQIEFLEALAAETLGKPLKEVAR